MFTFIIQPVSLLVEHRTTVREVAGSNLGPTLRVFK